RYRAPGRRSGQGAWPADRAGIPRQCAFELRALAHDRAALARGRAGRRADACAGVPAMSDPLSKQATASDVARAVMSGKVKAAAVIEAALTRIETSEPTVNAFTDVVADRARRRAAEIDAGLHRGPLMGVPFAVKNLF